MKLARTEGEAVVRNEKARELEPFVDMNLYSGYQMETNPESYAWINLDDVKLIKMFDKSGQSYIGGKSGQRHLGPV